MRTANILLLLSLLWLAVPARCEAAHTGIVDHEALMEIIQAEGVGKSRPLMVSFWASWCAPCLKEIPTIKALREEYTEAELGILLVSLDFDPKAYARFLEKQAVTLPSYLAGPDLMNAMSIKSIPMMLIFDAEGLAILEHEGYLSPAAMREKLKELLPQ